MTRTADLKVNCFAENASNTDIAKSIVEHFAGQNIKVLAIQQCPNKIARVTFEDRTACEMVQLRGELDMNGVKVAVVPPPPPPPNWVNVVVYNYPYDAPNSFINDTLGSFGTVQGIRFQHWTNLPEIATGTRVVRINLKSSIPRFITINSYRCKVWYRGQPIYCDICKEGTHIAFNCPYKGKCLACKGVGHFARNCPTVCFKCKGSHASDSCPNRRRWERVALDDDDFQSVTSEVDAGDVIASDVGGVAAEVNVVDTNTADPSLAVASAADGSAAAVTAADVSAVGSSAADPAPRGRARHFDFLSPRPLPASDASLPSSLPDERLNQLDELQTQSDGSPSQSALVGLSGIVNEACVTVLQSSSSPVAASSSGASCSVQPQDSVMAEPSFARKRDASDLSSSDGSFRSKPKSRSRKASGIPCPHLPSGVSAAASLARSRSSSSLKSSSRS